MAFKKVGKIVSGVAIALMGGVIAAEAVVGVRFGGVITQYFTAAAAKPIESSEFKEAAAASDDLCRKIGDEGIALLKNNNNVLPLQGDRKINLLGWNATEQGFLLSGIGSGSSTIQAEKKKSLLTAFKEEGWEVNEDIINFYNTYNRTDRGYGSNTISLINPFIDEEVGGNTLVNLLDDAVEFSDTALIVVSRIGGENVGEIPQNQPKTGSNHHTDQTRHYLQLSVEEESLIAAAAERFENVILLVNSTNQMQLDSVYDNDDVDAILNCSITGQSGAFGVPHILQGYITSEDESGEEKIEKFSPSGRLTDTWATDYKKAPSYLNYLRQGNNINYAEDIYFGYRYYETAYEEALNGNYDFSYEDEVIYPFGYGLSYTTFEWKVDKVSVPEGAFDKDSTIEFTLSCTNTGNYPGKDVIELFYSAPYIAGEIEKSAVNLADFEKTVLLEPGKTQTDIKVSVSAYDMTSFDCYDRNENNHACYELDAGNYILSFRENAHQLKKMSDNKAEFHYSLSDDIIFDTDPVTGENVEIRFTGDDAYAGVPLDGSTVYRTAPTYLSREDFEQTWPVPYNDPRMTSFNTSEITKANNFVDPRYEGSQMPEYGQDNGLHFAPNNVYNEDLIMEIAADYDSEVLEKLVSQMSREDWKNLVENGGFQTARVDSIDKPLMRNYDGPAGFNTSTQGVSKGGWTAFSSETLIGQTYSKTLARQLGRSMGSEAAATPGSPLNGWYAPGVNLHRTPFNGRNFEYYSEDPVLSGYLAANVIEGAKSNNLTCFLKHFTLSEPGVNARNLNTWLTEQNYRELYLKPFEIAVKKGGANAMMTAFNSVGGTWAGACGAQNMEILRGEWGFRGALLTDWSQGDGNMNTRQGLRAGNDFWLNPSTLSSPVSVSDPELMTAAKFAAKNIMYMICDTYAYYKNHDTSLDDGDSVNIGQIEETPQQTWWIGVFWGVGAALGVGMITLAIFAYVPFKKKEKSAA